jgi:3-hydroxyacyl-[acyl-carrier-protein] dehydratase
MLYQIRHITTEADGNIQVQVELNAGHAIFNGHFPSQPVLPGACMVQMLREVLQKAQGHRLTMHKGSNIKFTSVIVPYANQQLTFNIQMKPAADGFLSVNSTLYAGEVASMKFSGTYQIVL